MPAHWLSAGMIRPLASCLTILAAAACSPVYAQDKDDDIIVEGQRDTQRLAAGRWEVKLSKSYHFGRNLSEWNAMRPSGSEKSWRFCLPDSEVVSLMRLLVGEGQSDAAGSTHCGALQIKIGNGRFRATQNCNGGTMIVQSNPSDARSLPAKHALIVTGTYDSSHIQLDFEDRQEPVILDPSYSERPDMRRWTITGQRLGACEDE